ncbi:hypothetical protein ELH40_08410 [Rhizobium ruizarguesonis]|uniref:DUF4440 domain-containing protein n=3 Tax=Rhizobium TaxID=379 RepID=A0AB38IBM9_9HYPH|nr:hypothetical protein [Rhizobium leguminosarum bv. viciae]TBC17990.1 hypothetical protein ELH40_08410 [Rhizobium ruizarguesonis]
MFRSFKVWARFMDPLPDFQDLMDRMTASYRAGDAAACAAMFTLDAQLYSPYAAPAFGREAIEALHQEWTHGGVPDKKLQVLQSGGSNDTAWTLNAYSEDGGKVRGNSLAVWQRGRDRVWRIRICSLNDDQREVNHGPTKSYGLLGTEQ